MDGAWRVLLLLFRMLYNTYKEGEEGRKEGRACLVLLLCFMYIEVVMYAMLLSVELSLVIARG